MRRAMVEMEHTRADREVRLEAGDRSGDSTEGLHGDGSRRPTFITWLPHCSRSDAIAAAIEAPSHRIHFLAFKRPAIAPFKYVLQAVATVRRLRRERPSLVLVNTPPVVGALVVWAWCAANRTPFVIDAHTGTFDDPRWQWAMPLQRWLSRRAMATVVTGEHLAQRVRSWGARAEILDTVPVDLIEGPPVDLGPGHHVVVISTFSRDEPLAAVLEAAASTPDVTFHVTGDSRRAPFGPDDIPANVRLTGWVTDAEYHGLLRAADAVMSLTTRDHTMQQGGYEAMAAGKPFITSDWPVLRETFDRGAVHTDNSAEGIAAAVRTALAEGPTLSAEMRSVAARQEAGFWAAIERLRSLEA